MRRRKRNRKKAFMLVYIQFLISAASVWMVLVAFDSEGNMNPLGYAAGVLFWLGILGGVISYIIFFRRTFRKPNVLKFFSNKPAVIADIVFIISLAATIFLVCTNSANQIAAVMFVFLLVLSLYSHFLLNGKIFTAILIENKKGKGDSRK
ncbi:hypothetical protein [Faecalicatena orotica]|uniref:hypothetical protein n=1 Tax=Faecalicatena orotica TaxID=1544 RepID=UPI003217B0FA